MSTASYTKVPWERSSSFEKEECNDNLKDVNAETLSVDGTSAAEVMIMTMSSSVGASKDEDVRDDVSEDTEREPASEVSEARSENESISLTYSLSASKSVASASVASLASSKSAGFSNIKKTASGASAASSKIKKTASGASAPSSTAKRTASGASVASSTIKKTASNASAASSTIKATKSNVSTASSKRSEAMKIQKSSSAVSAASAKSAESTETDSLDQAGGTDGTQERNANLDTIDKVNVKRGLPPLAPKASHRRTSSNVSASSSLGRKLRNNVPTFFTRSRSNPLKQEPPVESDLVSRSFDAPRNLSQDKEGNKTDESPIQASEINENDVSVTMVETASDVASKTEGGETLTEDTITDVISESSDASDVEETTVTSSKSGTTEAAEVEKSEVEDAEVEDATSGETSREDDTNAISTDASSVPSESQAILDTIFNKLKADRSGETSDIQEDTNTEDAGSTASKSQAILNTIIKRVTESNEPSNDHISGTASHGAGNVKADEEHLSPGGNDECSDSGSISKTSSGPNPKSEPVFEDIQDPWPNPWSDAKADNTNPATSQSPFNPHIVPPTTTSETPFEQVVRAVDNASVDEVCKAATALSEGVAEDPPASHAKIEDAQHGVAMGVDELSKQEQSQEKPVISTQSEGEQDVQPQLSKEAEEVGNDSILAENIEAADLDDWKELLSADSATISSLKEEVGEAKAKRTSTDEPVGETKRRPPSFWKRTKNMLKPKSTEASQKPAITPAKSGRGGERKPPKGRKFKLGYLCLFQPCTKLSTIKEDEPAGASEPSSTSEVEKTTEMDQNAATVLSAVPSEQENSFSPEDLMDGMVPFHSHDELMHILDQNESHDDLMAEDRTTVAGDGLMQTLSGRTDVEEEAKDDLTQMETATSKHLSRSWLTDLPSVESMGGHEPHKTLSEVSSYGDLTKAESESAPNTVLNSFNFYVNAAAKAVQHNLFDVPAREFERMRDMTCHRGDISTNEGGGRSNLMNGDVATSESHDSITLAKTTTDTGIEASKITSNPFAVVFRELVEVLECGPGRTTVQPPKEKKKAFEEQKIEMLASGSRQQGTTDRKAADFVF